MADNKIEPRLVKLEIAMESLVEGQAKNAEKIEAMLQRAETLLTEVDEINEETKGMRQVWKDLQGTVRIGSAVKKIAIWVLGLPIVGAGIHSLALYVIQHFKG